MSQRKAQGMDALGMSERKEMQDLLQHLAESMGTLHQRVVQLEEARERHNDELERLRRRTYAHGDLLRSLPVSAWPPMMAGEFVALWEGDE